MSPRRVPVWMALIIAALAISGCAGTATAPQVTVTATTTVTATPGADSDSTRTTSRPSSGLPTMPEQELPPEASPVLAAVAEGGPFTYPQDGQTFQNRERILPSQPMGFYREFTVPTPGSPDRGARRLVVGSDGAIFYTSDHYQSFREVVP